MRLLNATKQSATYLACYALSTLLVIGGAVVAREIADQSDNLGLANALARWDGEHYREIATSGYSYDPSRTSRVAFFPAYPLCAGILAQSLGINVLTALLIVSNLSLASAFILFGHYLRVRDPPASGTQAMSQHEKAFALAAFGLWPTTFFFRMAYSESLFLLVGILILLAISLKWNLLFIAILGGLATAVRPVGIAFVAPILWHAWITSRSKWHAVARVAFSAIACSWGLAGYIFYQFWSFGEPFAFALTQDNWRMRPRVSLTEKLVSLLSLEPAWSIYIPGEFGYWRAVGDGMFPFSLQFANPIYVAIAIGLIGVGLWKRWITIYELLVCVPLIGISYFTRAYEMCMASQGRFAAVVFPTYIVIGHILSRIPPPLAVMLLALAGFLMSVYAGLFALGRTLI